MRDDRYPAARAATVGRDGRARVTSTPLSCGGLAWGHGGSIPGYSTRSAVTDDGRAAAVAVIALGAPTTEHRDNAQAPVDTALCR